MIGRRVLASARGLASGCNGGTARPNLGMPEDFSPTVGASKGASGQAGGLRFGGRPGTADPLAVLSLAARRRNSLRSPSARCVQTVGDKSVLDARCARGPRALRASAPKRRPPPCPNAPLLQRQFSSVQRANTVQLAAGGVRRGRFLGRRGAEGLWPRAQRVRELTCRRLFERSEPKVSEVSFGDGPRDRCSAPGHGTVPADCSVPGARPGACKRQGTQRSRLYPADRPSMSPRRTPPAASRAKRRRTTQRDTQRNTQRTTPKPA